MQKGDALLKSRLLFAYVGNVVRSFSRGMENT